MNRIKKTLYTLCVDNYAPDITALTFPLLKRYAEKVGADFQVITERKYPDMPPVYEKLQIRELGIGNDWNIYFDADALVHPETVDFTSLIHKDTVMHNACDMANVRWKYDEYFLRDGRNIGSCNWFAVASDWCINLWDQLDIPYEKALENIYPIPAELSSGITKEHLIDDYALSRNIAKYGLKFRKAIEIQAETGMQAANFFWHQYTVPVDEKVVMIRKVLGDWGIK